MRDFWGLLLILCPALLISGASTSQAQDCEVKIGVAGPMSGGAAAFGLNEKLGADFQAAMANANGGLQVGDKKCTVTVVGFDSKIHFSGRCRRCKLFRQRRYPRDPRTRRNSRGGGV